MCLIVLCFLSLCYMCIYLFDCYSMYMLFANKEFIHSFIFFLNVSDEQKLVYLLNPASVRHVRVIGFYLKRSSELRTEVLFQHK